MTKYRRCRKGFSLIELQVTMAVLAIVIAIGGPYLYGARIKAVLRSETDRLAGALQYARQQSIGSYGGTQHGVIFNESVEKDRYRSITEGKLFLLPGAVTLAESPDNIFFEKVTGYLDPPVPEPTIILRLQNFQAVIRLSSVGTIDTLPPERMP
jgi:prepilin-type N-terminal cleavage/methylation domain-containing protein